MTRIKSETQRKALIESVGESYMEIFPTATIESKLDVLEPSSYIAITCSPTKGVRETLDMAHRLADRGFKVVPHVAARMVRNKAHLREIVKRLDDTPIVSLFVPGGDAEEPKGDYSCALELLRDIADIEHKFIEIGVAAHPEGHPTVSNEVLMEHLLMKQELANYFVTQMCFDAEIMGNWLHELRDRGVTLPAWIGIPGASERSALIKTSLRIGVGDSLRFLKKNGKKAARLLSSREYWPDDLLYGLAPYIADPAFNISGHHVYCFNQVDRAERWRHDFIERIRSNQTG
ncbi:MAG: methylenetetrahydrofolate reductase [Gammaproteobacteria bacterium]|nr:methylenetetrahydrofolate reductase [Gammaproteobacteria bacterium]MDH3751623.1 methylenetetrahydrofolate reductase [Gammaproteobacteria bacterium]MDH3805181.1 methylenetetrahydrofolate reductase [Gammaproteobacteria bacterium]